MKVTTGLVVLLLLGGGVSAARVPSRKACREACADQRFLCSTARCRRAVIRACRHQGLDVCTATTIPLPTTTTTERPGTTTTTSSSEPEPPTSTTTTRTIFRAGTTTTSTLPVITGSTSQWVPDLGPGGVVSPFDRGFTTAEPATIRVEFNTQYGDLEFSLFPSGVAKQWARWCLDDDLTFWQDGRQVAGGSGAACRNYDLKPSVRTVVGVDADGTKALTVRNRIGPVEFTFPPVLCPAEGGFCVYPDVIPPPR